MGIGELFTKYGSDKDTRHSYGEVYDRLIEEVRQVGVPGYPKNVLEIGYGKSGAGIRAFRDVLGKLGGGFHALENWEENFPDREFEPGIHIHGADQRNAGDLAAFAEGFERYFSLIVDDGCHEIEAQTLSAAALWPTLQGGGIYVVEDVQNIDHVSRFKSFPGFEVVDRRKVKGRYDDVLVILRKS